MKVFLNVTAIGEGNEGPRFAWFDATPEFLARVKQLQALVASHGLSCVCEWHSIDWLDNDDWRMACEELVVAKGRFWFSGSPKHVYYAVETNAVYEDIEDLIAKALAAGKAEVFYRLHEGDIDDLYAYGILEPLPDEDTV